MSDTSKPIEVFISYADEDEDESLCNKLEKHLSTLRWRGRGIAVWHHRHVAPGTNLMQAINEHLEQASIIILLISADFLASKGIEMQHALRRHQTGQARVIPILLRPVNWKGAPFANLQVLPSNRVPITKWENQDAAFVDVVRDISQAIQDFGAPPTTLGAVLKSPAGHIVLGTTDVTIGRAPDNTCPVTDSQVSGYHAVIRQHGQGYAILDLKSKNGTFVNEQALSPETPRMLRRGDVIRVSMTTFEYTDGISVAPIPTPPTLETPIQATPLPKATGGVLVAPIPAAPITPETPMRATPLPNVQASATPIAVDQRPAMSLVQSPAINISFPSTPSSSQKRRSWGLWITLIVIVVCGTLSVIGYGNKAISSLPNLVGSNGTSSSSPTNLVGSYQGSMVSHAQFRQTLNISVLQESQDGSVSGNVEIGLSSVALDTGSAQKDVSVHFVTKPFMVSYLSMFYTFDGKVSKNNSGKTEMEGTFTGQYTSYAATSASGDWDVVAS